MGQPGLEVVFVCAYSAVLLVVAVIFDRLGQRSAVKSAAWRTGNFLYHDDADAWKCHEDQWLWPASFDPDKRVIRYVGQHEICGRCPAKTECSPSPGPRELTRQVDPWPHSEAGRFHRGVSVAIIAVALMMVAVTLLFSAGTPADLILLLAALALVLAVGIPLARHLWKTPSGFPEHLVLDRSELPTVALDGYRSTRLTKEALDAERDALSVENVDAVLARHTSAVALPIPRYRSDRRNS